MKVPKFMSAAMIAAAVLTVAACGGDDSDAPPTVESAATSAATGDASAGPTVYPSIEALNEMLETALDPDVPNAEKVDLVEGSERDPAIFDELVAARDDNPDITYELTPPIIPAGFGQARVKVRVATEGNPPTTVDATIVYDDDRWKLSNQTVCTLLGAYDVESAMCSAPGN